MEEEGVVVEEVGETVRVEVLRKGWCGGCRLCSIGALGKRVTEAENPIGAKKGQRVMIEVPSTGLLVAAFILYILPVIFLVGGFIIGRWVSHVIGFAGEGLSIMVGMALFIFSFLFIYSYNRWAERTKGFRPKIISIKA
jgi:sigma-E factor negative regulatory protein RseC